MQHYSEDSIVSPEKHQDGIQRFDVINTKYGTRKHSTLAFYKEAMGPDLFGSFSKFSILRNPYDRLISYYFSPHRGIQTWDRTAFISLVDEVPPAGHYLLLTQSKDPLMANEGCSVEPEQLPLDHHIDFLMRFETLNRDFHRLCLALDIPSSPLPRRNRSERKHYSHYYDDELKEMVSKKYRDEIEFGQYEFEAVQHQTN